MSAMSGLRGRVVLVTGASGGLGGELSRQLAAAGAVVIASGRNLRKLDKLHAAIEAAGGQCQLYPMDLAGARPEDLAECIGRIVQVHGHLDGLIHCAADFPGLTPLAHADPGRLAQSLHVNLTARIWLTQAALPALEAAAGVVLFVHDRPGRVDGAYWGGYGLSQAAHPALLSMLRAEMPHGVRVLDFQPAPMPTALRARAYSHEPGAVDSPGQVAAGCIARLGQAWTGSPPSVGAALVQ